MNNNKEGGGFREGLLSLECRIGRVVTTARTNTRNKPIFGNAKKETEKAASCSVQIGMGACPFTPSFLGNAPAHSESRVSLDRLGFQR